MLATVDRSREGVLSGKEEQWSTLSESYVRSVALFFQRTIIDIYRAGHESLENTSAFLAWNTDVALQEKMQSPDRVFICKSDDKGEIIGALHVRVRAKYPNQAIIQWIGVNESVRGQGIWSGLIWDAIPELKTKGIQWLFSRIHEDNKTSEKLHIRSGFEQVSAEEEFQLPSEDCFNWYVHSISQ